MSKKTLVVITNYNTDIPCLKQAFDSICNLVDETLIISSRSNSLGAKINQALSLGYDYTIIMNDDAAFEVGDINSLCRPGKLTYPLINGRSLGKFHAHVMCIPKEVAIRTKGYPEEYENAYFDDNDFQFRCVSEGIPVEEVSGVSFNHPPHGGTTLHTIPAWQDMFERNKEKFLKKWGRLP